MKEKVYLAGPLFTKYEIEIRKKEHNLFKKEFPNIDAFAPINAPFNGQNPTNQTIFETDKAEMDSSNIFIFDLNNMDTGTLVELGLVIERKINDPSIEIYSYLWDLRMSRRDGDSPFDKPFGVNGFVIGGAQRYGELVHTFEEVIELIKSKRT